MNIEVLKQKVAEIEEILYGYLPKEEGLQKTVLEAMNYSVRAGGKRLRPMLMRETYRLFGGEDKVVEPFLAAIEFIHTYSLVHDDLPALDNDEYRRGKKTTHAVYGECMGILAGDALLNYAYEVAASAFELEVSPRVAKALQVLAKKAGIYGMVGGQIADIESEGKTVGLDVIEFIHENKTGALIEASMMVGAILAGASEEEVAKIEQVASDVGIAFQIRDDILDVVSDTETLGKPVGSDEKNQKSTYVTLKGLRQAERDVEVYSERALSVLGSFEGKNEFLVDLIRMLIDRKK